MPTPLDKLNAKVFRQHLQTKFNVNPGGGQALALELVEVLESDDNTKMEFFSLRFRGPFTPRLAQQIHRLEHEQLGTFEVFLTPISAEPKEGTVYEVIFHRFRRQP